MWSHGHGPRSVDGAGRTHRCLGKRCRRAGTVRRASAHPWEDHRDCLHVETGPQSQHRSGILASTPKGQDSKVPFHKEGNSLVPLPPDLQGLSGPPGTQAGWATNGSCQLLKASATGVGRRAATLTLTSDLARLTSFWVSVSSSTK